MSDFLASGPQATKKLQDQVARAQGDTSRRPALTRASKGWEIPDQATPPAPASGAHLYASGGNLMVRKEDGDTFVIEPAPDIPFSQGAPVASPPVFTSPTSLGTDFTAANAAYQALRTDCQSGLRATLIALLQVLRNAGIIDT